MAKAARTFPTPTDWQVKYKLPKVLKKGDVIPDELVSLLENNNPGLIDTMEKQWNSGFKKVVDYVEDSLRDVTVKSPEKEEVLVKPKAKKKK